MTDMYWHRSSFGDNWITISKIPTGLSCCPSRRNAFSMAFHSQIGIFLMVVKWLQQLHITYFQAQVKGNETTSCLVIPTVDLRFTLSGLAQIRWPPGAISVARLDTWIGLGSSEVSTPPKPVLNNGAREAFYRAYFT